MIHLTDEGIRSPKLNPLRERTPPFDNKTQQQHKIKSRVLTSSCTASTFGLLPVRRRPEPGPLLAVVASDLDLWWVLLDGETKTSASPSTGLSGVGMAREKEGEESMLLLWCLR